MNWHVVTFDLDRDQPPGLAPQIAFVNHAHQTYLRLSAPEGFALYYFHNVPKLLYSFFFSPVASELFADYIQQHRGVAWNKLLPEGTQFLIGDESFRPPLLPPIK